MKLQEPWRFPFGGTDRSRKISLQAQVCHKMAAVIQPVHYSPGVPDHGRHPLQRAATHARAAAHAERCVGEPEAHQLQVFLFLNYMGLSTR